MATTAPRMLRRAEQRARWPERSRPVHATLAGISLALGLVTVLGWLLGLEAVVKPFPSLPEMRLWTAMCIVLLAVGALVRPREVRWAAVAAVLVIVTLGLASHVLGVETGLGAVSPDNFTVPADTAFAWRPAWPALLSFLCLALSLTARDLGRNRRAQALALLPLLLGLLSSYGYLYDAQLLYQPGAYQVTAVTTSVVIVLLSLAVWLSVPHGLLQWITWGRDPGASLQRMLWPIALVLVPLAGYVRVRAERSGLVGAALGTAMLVTFAAVVLILTGALVGRQSRRRDVERDQLLDEVGRVNLELEERVKTRSHQLNRQRTKLALFEERDRIARDLHDRVIQRIFASGLQLAALSRAATKEAQASGRTDTKLSDALDTVATELDLAIRELRNSIFELTTLDDHDDLHQVVVDIATRASRILGFMPRIEVAGETSSLRPDLVAHAASVIQEGLSNVARHARAAGAQVTVTALPEEFSVVIADDGVGLPDPLPRSSGITNMLNRAKGLGGTATWQPDEPAGTVFTWQVPMHGDGASDDAASEEQADHGYDSALASPR